MAGSIISIQTYVVVLAIAFFTQLNCFIHMHVIVEYLFIVYIVQVHCFCKYLLREFLISPTCSMCDRSYTKKKPIKVELITRAVHKYPLVGEGAAYYFHFITSGPRI